MPLAGERPLVAEPAVLTTIGVCAPPEPPEGAPCWMLMSGPPFRGIATALMTIAATASSPTITTTTSVNRLLSVNGRDLHKLELLSPSTTYPLLQQSNGWRIRMEHL